MRYLILFLVLVAEPVLADIGGTACARSQEIIENAKGSAIDSTKRQRILDNLYTRACQTPTDATTATCALPSPTNAQKCSALNAWVAGYLRGQTGLPAAIAAQTTVNAAQSAAEADWD